MFNRTWWIIAGYCGFLLIVVASFNVYLKRQTGEGLFGAFNFDIPGSLLRRNF